MDQIRDKDGFIELQRKYSELYKKANYLTDRTVVIDRIYEYDIRSANISAMKASGKFDDKILAMLENLNKQAREEAVGKMIRRDKDHIIWPTIAKGIRNAKEQLFRYNGLEDENILSIKNDAVFVIGRKLKYTTFGPLEFRPKNQYAGYMQIEKVEMYYDKRHRRIDFKGIRDEVVNHPDHQSGMVQFLLQVFQYLSMDQENELRQFLIQFTHDYKAMKLPKQYYREFSGNNEYHTKIELSGFEYNLTEIGQNDLDIINPVYNYTKFILPIIRQFM